MMPVPKRKPIEAYDGSQQGLILGIFDDMQAEIDEKEAAKKAYRERISQKLILGKLADCEIQRLEWKANYMRRNGWEPWSEKAPEWVQKIDREWQEGNYRKYSPVEKPTEGGEVKNAAP